MNALIRNGTYRKLTAARALPCLKWGGVLALMLAGQAASAGDTSQCSFIRDSDLQAYCRGTAGGNQSACSSIRNADLQALCRAEAGGGQAQCGFIRDSDQRALCMAKAKP